MGRRSINFTKSGKYMNPTDQARKEARKKELKKNKKQRMMVRMAVLKGKDPSKLLEEMDVIDNMEYDPNAPASLSERVLKDKRKKLKETYDRVISMYEKEDPEYAMELRSGEVEYDKRRHTKKMLFDQVKNAEKVQLDQIPLPDAPNLPTLPAQIPLPGDIPLPMADQDDFLPPKGILKKSSAYERSKMADLPMKKRKPPGPPPGAPPMLSDSEGEDGEDMEDIQLPSGRPADRSDYSDSDSEGETIRAKHRKIRFEDDEEEEEEDDNTDEEEEDDMENGKRRRKKLKPAVSALQAKMLAMAGQEIPMITKEEQERVERDLVRRQQEEELTEQRLQQAVRQLEKKRERQSTGRGLDDDDDEDDEKDPRDLTAPGIPPGPLPTLPPGPPPGLPPMMFRPPPLRGAPMGAPPRLLPPGPPPGRPPGMPPGPPPGLPPNLRGMPPRLPPGPPGVPPPRMRPPPGMVHNLPPVGGRLGANPNVLSAPPSIMKPPKEDDKKSTATIEAKPQIKNVIGDVTKFMPTALKVRRDVRDSKGRILHKVSGKDEQTMVKAAPTVQPKTKDDAYDTFMREMENFL